MRCPFCVLLHGVVVVVVVVVGGGGGGVVVVVVVIDGVGVVSLCLVWLWLLRLMLCV